MPTAPDSRWTEEEALTAIGFIVFAFLAVCVAVEVLS